MLNRLVHRLIKIVWLVVKVVLKKLIRRMFYLKGYNACISITNIYYKIGWELLIESTIITCGPRSNELGELTIEYHMVL